MSGPLTLHDVQGGTARPEIGAVTGFLLKTIRSALGHRQTDLAELLNVDVTTIQGWESGRRSLTALRASDVVRLRQRLTSLGAPTVATSLLAEAIEADTILSAACHAGESPLSPDGHPLATAVHRRRLVGLITWPFTGIVPRQIRHLPKPTGRGPMADRPTLDATAEKQFFDHMLVTADSTAGTTHTLLRRQAIYLAGYDRRSSSADWLIQAQRRITRQAAADTDLPSVILNRSAALALARQGDNEPIRSYIRDRLDSDDHSLANLTYWAYWLGEIPETYSDDGEMIRLESGTWGGHRLMEHLLGHLADPTNVELNIHSLWTLVLARPGLLERNPELRSRAAHSVEQAECRADLSKRAQRELASLHCAITLAGR